MTRKSIALILSLGVAAGPALAEEPIATDRPDFVESSQTVGLGRWQIETSVAWEEDEDGAFEASAFSTPTLLRYGFAESTGNCASRPMASSTPSCAVRACAWTKTASPTSPSA